MQVLIRQGQLVSNHAIVDHHRQLETAFRSVKAALSAAERSCAHTELKMLLTAHEDPGQARMAAELAALEKLQPMTREYYQKLEHIRSAVAEVPGTVELRQRLIMHAQTCPTIFYARRE